MGSAPTLRTSTRIIPPKPFPALRPPPPMPSQMKKYCGQVRNTRIVTNQIETLIFLLYSTGSTAAGGGLISAVNPRASSILFVPGNKPRLSSGQRQRLHRVSDGTAGGLAAGKQPLSPEVIDTSLSPAWGAVWWPPCSQDVSPNLMLPPKAQ